MNYNYWLEHEWKKNRNYRPEGPMVQPYFRVSSKKQDRTQQFTGFAKCKHLFNIPTINILKELEENIGFTRRWEPSLIKKGLRQLEQMIKDRKLNIIWVDSLDRLGAGWTWEDIYSLCKKNDVEIFATSWKEGTGIWLTDPSIKGAIQEAASSAWTEVEKKSDRTRKQKTLLAQSGRYLGGEDPSLACDLLVKEYREILPTAEETTTTTDWDTYLDIVHENDKKWQFVRDLYRLERISVEYLDKTNKKNTKRNIKKTMINKDGSDGAVSYHSKHPPKEKNEFIYYIRTRNVENIKAIQWAFEYFDGHETTYSNMARLWKEKGLPSQRKTLHTSKGIKLLLSSYAVIGKPTWNKVSKAPFARTIDGEYSYVRESDYEPINPEEIKQGLPAKYPKRNFSNDMKDWCIPPQLWEPLVPVELFMRVQEKIERIKRNSPHSLEKNPTQERAPRSDKAFLNGMAICTCGSKMSLDYGGTKKTKSFTYSCKCSRDRKFHNTPLVILERCIEAFLDKIDKPFVHTADTYLWEYDHKNLQEALIGSYRELYANSTQVVGTMLHAIENYQNIISDTCMGQLKAVAPELAHENSLHTTIGSTIILPVVEGDKPYLASNSNRIKIGEVYDLFHRENKTNIENEIERLQGQKKNLLKTNLALYKLEVPSESTLQATTEEMAKIDAEILALSESLIDRRDTENNLWQRVKELQQDVLDAKSAQGTGDRLALRAYLNKIISKIVIDTQDEERVITFVCLDGTTHEFLGSKFGWVPGGVRKVYSYDDYVAEGLKLLIGKKRSEKTIAKYTDKELHDLGKRTIEKRKEYFADVVVKRRQHEAYLRHKNGLSGKVGRPKKT